MATTGFMFCRWPPRNYKQDLRKLDIKFRKLVRTILGRPDGANSATGQDILHERNARVFECTEQAGVKFNAWRDARDNIGNSQIALPTFRTTLG